MFKIVEKHLFVITFFTLLLLPLLCVNRIEGKISKTENRTLASPAKLVSSSGELNKNYLSDLSSWFDDNLGFRDTFVKGDAYLQYHIFDRIKDMPLGEHGELAPIPYLDDYQHSNILSDDEVYEYVNAYDDIYQFLSDQGIQVYYMQCWDKHSIYPEQYTDAIRIMNDVSKTEQVEKGLINGTGMTVISIKKALLDAKSEYEVYGTWADPWHWTNRGAFIGYQELIRSINSNNGGKYRELKESDFNITMSDVGMTYYGAIHEEDIAEVFSLKNGTARNVPKKLVFIPDSNNAANTVKYYVNNAVSNDDTVLVLGDSYIHDSGIIEYLAESFKNTIMFNGTAATQNQLVKIVNTYKPDIVIMENAERCNYRFAEAVDVSNDLKAYSYSVGDEIKFYSTEANADKYIIKGFSEIEDNYTWTNGKDASICLYIPNARVGEKVRVSLNIDGSVTKNQTVSIIINGVKVLPETIIDGECNLNCIFEMPKSKMMLMDIELPNAVSPWDLGQSNEDIRELGIMIKSIIVEK